MHVFICDNCLSLATTKLSDLSLNSSSDMAANPFSRKPYHCKAMLLLKLSVSRVPAWVPWPCNTLGASCEFQSSAEGASPIGHTQSSART